MARTDSFDVGLGDRDPIKPKKDKDKKDKDKNEDRVPIWEKGGDPLGQGVEFGGQVLNFAKDLGETVLDAVDRFGNISQGSNTDQDYITQDKSGNINVNAEQPIIDAATIFGPKIMGNAWKVAKGGVAETWAREVAPGVKAAEDWLGGLFGRGGETPKPTGGSGPKPSDTKPFKPTGGKPDFETPAPNPKEMWGDWTKGKGEKPGTGGFGAPGKDGGVKTPAMSTVGAGTKSANATWESWAPKQSTGSWEGPWAHSNVSPTIAPPSTAPITINPLKPDAAPVVPRNVPPERVRMVPVISPTKQQNEDDIKPAATFPWITPDSALEGTTDRDPALQPQGQPEPAVNPNTKTKVVTENSKKRTPKGGTVDIKGEDPDTPYVY
jgi:hypothetical protein